MNKQGTVKRTIKYTTKDGAEKNRYVSVGEYWTDGDRKSVKLYATLNTDEQWLNIYPLEETSPTHKFNKKVHDTLPDDISLKNIPF